MSTVSEHLQRTQLGKEIWLYQLDLTNHDQGTFYWVTGPAGATVYSITFDGIVYSPYGVTCEGFDASDDGPMPRPTLTFDNRLKLFTPLVVYNKHLRGSKLTRICTYDRFLDDGVDPDPGAVFERDEYYINQMMELNDEEGYIKFELVSALDITGAEIPAQLATRDGCDANYRVYNAALDEFDYTDATCGYTGEEYLDTLGQPTTKANDTCTKLWARCRNPETFTACPGMAKFRIR